MKLYCYALVKVKHMETVYSYISDDPAITVGSRVLVPFGWTNAEWRGTVTDIRFCTEKDAPFPVERTKHILRLLSEEEYEADRNPREGDDSDAWEMARYLDRTKEYDYDYLFRWACEHGDELDSKATMEQVVRCYRLCAEQRMPQACLNLGALYYNGTCLERDYAKAAALYQIAADSGLPEGIRNLGYCYYYGRHQAADYGKAYEYFSKGALLFGDANCLYKLGDMYRDGLGVAQNRQYAYILYDRAAKIAGEQEEYDFCKADIYLRLGECKLRGTGVTADIETAHTLLQIALLGFYERRKTDSFVGGLIAKTKALIAQAQAGLDNEIVAAPQ